MIDRDAPSNNDLLNESHFGDDPGGCGGAILHMGMGVAKNMGLIYLAHNLKNGETLSDTNLYMVAVAGMVMAYELLKDKDLIVWQLISLVSSLVTGGLAGDGVAGSIAAVGGGLVSSAIGLLEGGVASRTSSE